MSEMVDEVRDFFDRFAYVEALAIVVVFALLARLVDRLLSVSLRRAVARSETDFDDKLIDIVHRPVLTTVSLIGLILATYRLDFSLERSIRF